MKALLEARHMQFKPLASDAVRDRGAYREPLRKAVRFTNYVPDSQQLGTSASKFDFDVNAFEQRVVQAATDLVLDYETALQVS